MLQSQGARFARPRRATVLLAAAIGAFVCVSNFSQSAQAQTYKVIHNFTNQGSDGATPFGGLILDRHGNLYGTTWLGGLYGSGSVYELSPSGSSWTHRTLYSFKGIQDGAGPGFGSLVMRDDYALYGTTEGGGYFGTLFKVRAHPGPCAKPPCTWPETQIHQFGRGLDGDEPIGGAALDSQGHIYGTTLLGGANGNGTVWEAMRSGYRWLERVIYSFGTGADAMNPAAGVTVDPQGNLYGTTPAGGAFGNGAVYMLSPSGSGFTESVLYSFQGTSDGQNPVGGLILDASGNLYGTTFDGGINGGGTVYQLSPSTSGWTFTVLYSFVGGYGGPYNKLTLDSNGNLYGFTNAEGANGFGSIFKLTPGSAGWTYTDLYDFQNGTDGGLPYGSVAVDANGNVFGTASSGGSKNQGVVFEITP